MRKQILIPHEVGLDFVPPFFLLVTGLGFCIHNGGLGWREGVLELLYEGDEERKSIDE